MPFLNSFFVCNFYKWMNKWIFVKKVYVLSIFNLFTQEDFLSEKIFPRILITRSADILTITFADDLVLYLKKVSEYCHLNALQMNAEKVQSNNLTEKFLSQNKKKKNWNLFHLIKKNLEYVNQYQSTLSLNFCLQWNMKWNEINLYSI